MKHVVGKGALLGVLLGIGSLACGCGSGEEEPEPDGADAGDSDPALLFTQVSAGGYHTCALDQAGRVHCFGSDSLGQSTPPGETGFVFVSCGWAHSCAIGAGGAAHCWGSDMAGEVGQAMEQETPQNGRACAVGGNGYGLQQIPQILSNTGESGRHGPRTNETLGLIGR